MDILRFSLHRQRLRQAVQCQFEAAIVDLPEVAINTGGRGCVEDAPVALIAHARPSRVQDAKRPQQVYLVKVVPVGCSHLVEGHVAQKAGVVDDDVNPAEVV